MHAAHLRACRPHGVLSVHRAGCALGRHAGRHEPRVHVGASACLPTAEHVLVSALTAPAVLPLPSFYEAPAGWRSCELLLRLPHALLHVWLRTCA